MKFNKLARKYPNKTAVITGAASGLGFAFTNLLIQDGWKIFAIDINTESLESIKEKNLNVHQLDITEIDSFEKLLLSFCTTNKIDLLFNNAGVGEGTSFVDYELQNWDWIININLKALIAGSKFLLPHFISNDNGMIVNIASAAGYSNLPYMSPYNVTKAGVISLSESLSHELSKTNVKVKLITPTFFKSSIMQYSKGDKRRIYSAEKVINSAKINSQQSATIILSRLHKSSNNIRFPLNANILYYVKRLSPRTFSWLVKKFLVK